MPRTSDAGTSISSPSSASVSCSFCHDEVSGRAIAGTAACILMSSVSRSLGIRLPRKSVIYLSTLGTTHTAVSGCGCSLNRASLSCFDRQCLKCFYKYFTIGSGGVNVPSLDCTEEAGSKGTADELGNPIPLTTVTETEAVPALSPCPILGRLEWVRRPTVISCRTLPVVSLGLICIGPVPRFGVGSRRVLMRTVRPLMSPPVFDGQR